MEKQSLECRAWGVGIKTLRAAVVAAVMAAATAGLDWVVHMPNGMIFFIATLPIFIGSIHFQ